MFSPWVFDSLVDHLYSQTNEKYSLFTDCNLSSANEYQLINKWLQKSRHNTMDDKGGFFCFSSTKSNKAISTRLFSLEPLDSLRLDGHKYTYKCDT